MVPFLEAVARLETSVHGPDHQAAAIEAGLDVDAVAKELHALIDAGYVSAHEAHDLANVFFGNLRLLEEARF